MIYIDNQITQAPDSGNGITEAQVTTQETEQPVEAPATETTETVSENQDSFFDPNTVPEELKPAYKQMQAAFTKKTQEAAQQRKEAEALRADAENYRKYQSHIQKIEEMEKSRANDQVSPEMAALEQKYREAGYSDEAIEMMKMGLEFTLNHFNQTTAQKEHQHWVNTQIAEASKVDPRLTDVNLTYQTDDGEKVTFGQMVESIAMTDPNISKDIVGATRRAIKKVDALIGRSKIEGKTELSEAAKAKARQFPVNPSSPQSTSETEAKGSIREIGKQTAAELGIKL